MKSTLLALALLTLAGCNSKAKQDDEKKAEKTMVKKAIEKPVETETSTQDDHLKYNKLGLAVKSGNIEEVQQLLKSGADIEDAAEDEYYAYGALYVAVNKGNEEMVKFLIDNKANINPNINDEGYTLMIAAIDSKRKNIIDLLIRSGTNVGASTDIEGNKKFIPILQATLTDQKDVVKSLLEKGADPQEMSFEGFSAYKYAKENNKDIFALFKK